MFELSYSSKANPDIDIKDILERSLKFNAENDLTGCLVYYKEQFIQILERSEEIIEDFYARIEKDERHYDVKRLYSNYKGKRVFEEWRIAFVNFNDPELSELSNELFEQNLLVFSELYERPSMTLNLFWRKVKQIIKA
jgi:hypothetical protein